MRLIAALGLAAGLMLFGGAAHAQEDTKCLPARIVSWENNSVTLYGEDGNVLETVTGRPKLNAPIEVVACRPGLYKFRWRNQLAYVDRLDVKTDSAFPCEGLANAASQSETQMTVAGQNMLGGRKCPHHR